MEVWSPHPPSDERYERIVTELVLHTIMLSTKI